MKVQKKPIHSRIMQSGSWTQTSSQDSQGQLNMRTLVWLILRACSNTILITKSRENCDKSMRTWAWRMIVESMHGIRYKYGSERVTRPKREERRCVFAKLRIYSLTGTSCSTAIMAARLSATRAARRSRAAWLGYLWLDI